MTELDSATEVVTLDSMLDALGSAVVSLRVAPAGTQWPIRTVALFDADDLAAAADSGVLVADLCVLAGVPRRRHSRGSIGWPMSTRRRGRWRW